MPDQDYPVAIPGGRLRVYLRSTDYAPHTHVELLGDLPGVYDYVTMQLPPEVMLGCRGGGLVPCLSWPGRGRCEITAKQMSPPRGGDIMARYYLRIIDGDERVKSIQIKRLRDRIAPDAADLLLPGGHIYPELAGEHADASWYQQIAILHGGDNRRLDVHGRTIANLAAAIPASPASIKRWLAGTAVPNLAAQAAIERLYNEQRRSK